MLRGEHLYLRAMEPEDLKFLYDVENDTDLWEISGTTAPYSKYVLEQYLANAHRDIFDVKQLRLCICTLEAAVIGLIDLFDFDPKNHRAGLGIVILQASDRNKGIGAEAISLLCEYSFSILQMNQVYANILEDNKASIYLFEKLGFELVGCKKAWIYADGNYKNELLYQKIKR